MQKRGIIVKIQGRLRKIGKITVDYCGRGLNVKNYPAKPSPILQATLAPATLIDFAGISVHA